VPLLRTGKSLWEQLAESPTDGEVFNRAMQTFAAAVRIEPIWKLDWSEVGTVVDVGGGSGGMLLPLLRRESHLQGILFDQPHLEAESRAAIHNAGLEDRCRFEGGSFFDRVPEGADTYLLSAILHDWTDDDAVRILRSCNEAARTDSRLIVVEYLIPPGDAPHPGKSLDLLMLVWVGGRERTETEFRALLAKGGFRLERIIVTSSGFCALDASPQ
jgi:SAM-dependent methyltransferase